MVVPLEGEKTRLEDTNRGTVYKLLGILNKKKEWIKLIDQTMCIDWQSMLIYNQSEFGMVVIQLVRIRTN